MCEHLKCLPFCLILSACLVACQELSPNKITANVSSAAKGPESTITMDPDEVSLDETVSPGADVASFAENPNASGNNVESDGINGRDGMSDENGEHNCTVRDIPGEYVCKGACVNSTTAMNMNQMMVRIEEYDPYNEVLWLGDPSDDAHIDDHRFFRRTRWWYTSPNMPLDMVFAAGPRPAICSVEPRGINVLNMRTPPRVRCMSTDMNLDPITGAILQYDRDCNFSEMVEYIPWQFLCHIRCTRM